MSSCLLPCSFRAAALSQRAILERTAGYLVVTAAVALVVFEARAADVEPDLLRAVVLIVTGCAVLVA